MTYEIYDARDHKVVVRDLTYRQALAFVEKHGRQPWGYRYSYWKQEG